jgi:hypothetical protein
MQVKTVVKNLLNRYRTLSWAKGRGIDPMGVIILDGAYPEACRDIPIRNSLYNEIAGGVTSLTLVTDIPTIKMDELDDLVRRLTRTLSAAEAAVPETKPEPKPAAKPAEAPAAPKAPATTAFQKATEVEGPKNVPMFPEAVERAAQNRQQQTKIMCGDPKDITRTPVPELEQLANGSKTPDTIERSGIKRTRGPNKPKN